MALEHPSTLAVWLKLDLRMMAILLLGIQTGVSRLEMVTALCTLTTQRPGTPEAH